VSEPCARAAMGRARETRCVSKETMSFMALMVRRIAGTLNGTCG
jgi:hypothetical protein